MDMDDRDKRTEVVEMRILRPFAEHTQL